MAGVVPAEVATRCASMQRRMDAMLSRPGRPDGSSPDLFILHRTASAYLPAALRAYAGQMRADAAEGAVAGGRTPDQVLQEQLELIESRLAGIDAAMETNDLDRLLEHGQFLEERFGRTSDDVAAPLPRA